MPKIITVYINGTDEPDDFASTRTSRLRSSFRTSLANVLNKLTMQDQNNISICLDGCGINNPYIRDLSAIFTWNLENQVNDLVKKIKEQMGSEKIILNLYGFSRGGAGVYLLAKKLKDVDPAQLEMNILAFEPVPGNFIYNVYVDKFFGLNLTLSSLISDLSDCKSLKRVQSLYTNEPLPDIDCHAPILPAFSSACEHQADVIPGCHKNAESFQVIYNSNIQKYDVKHSNIQSGITFHIVVDFLKKCGTSFDFDKMNLSEELKDSNHLPKLYNQYVATNRLQPMTRSMHFSNAIKTAPLNSNRFLNLNEQSQHDEIMDPSNNALSIKDYNPTPSYTNGQKSAARIVYPALAFSATICVLAKDNKLSNIFKPNL